MQKNMVFTITGPDKIGLVERVSRIVADHAGNIEASRMAHLGGEFAMLMLVKINEEQMDDLTRQFEKLKTEGYEVTGAITGHEDPAKYKGWLPYKIEVTGADHEGIIHRIASFLSRSGFNIEKINTDTVIAPVSGTALFTMDAIFLVPADKPFAGWHKSLQALGEELNVEIEVAPFKG